MDAEPQAVIVIPTLDLERGASTARQAMALAGVPCALVLVVDSVRRGGRLPTNAGFEAALHLGAPFVCYLNDDVTIEQQGWLQWLIEALQQDASYGIACPSGPCRSKPQKRGRPGSGPGVFVVDHPLAWFCAVLKREMVADVGLLSEQLIHYACDSEYTRRAQQYGWRSIWVRDVWVGHDPGEPVAEFWEQDRAWYEEHWGKFGCYTRALREKSSAAG